MHENDFELVAEEAQEDGSRLLTVRVAAAGLTRQYRVTREGVQLVGEPLRVGGHDMTSIIGKRVREWIHSRGLDRFGEE